MDELVEQPYVPDSAAARRSALILAALCGITVIVVGAWLLALQPHLQAHWQSGARGEVQLVSANDEALAAHRAQALAGLRDSDEHVVALDSLVLHRSPRWLVDDADRVRHAELHAAAAAALAQPTAGLAFADGSTAEVPMTMRGFAGLGTAFWLLSAFGLLLYLAAVTMLLARWSVPNLLFALMSLCQAGNLALTAVGSAYGLALPRALQVWDMPLRVAFDLVTAAAAVHTACLLYPKDRVKTARTIVWGAWGAVTVLVALEAAGRLEHAWWWAQGGVAGLGALAIVVLHLAERAAPHPQAAQLRRIGTGALGTWLLLTLALALTLQLPAVPHPVADVVATTWYVFLSSLLLLVPFFMRTRQILREFALLAAISTIAISLDLIFMALFALGQFPSLALALFVALALYAGARRWILDQLLGSSQLTTERMFEQLYRIAREVEAHPRRVPALLLHLLRDLFEPIEAEPVGAAMGPRARVGDGGATLVVPIASLATGAEQPHGALRLCFARHGRRLFTREDARLADRIVEQLRRAVAYDHAVEQGRREERARLAQDLHDDIGARLLTLMYKAPTPEIEEYVRHTLKDLKTLTRGLAASGHRLGDAAAEWKADLTQRLTAAGILLGWNYSADREVMLSVVQWSALTRIVRELVSNAIAHAQATRVDLAIELSGNALQLNLTDDGIGTDPQTWSHGLGLGGVRKRVKQLGGDVEWRRTAPSGIECRVRLGLEPVPD
jgi:signal transduction histidine kinase